MAEKGGTKRKKFKENKLLKIVCIIGSIIHIIFLITHFILFETELPIYLELNKYLIWPIIIYGSYLTYNDAVIIKAGMTSEKEKTFDTKTWNPLTWASIVLVLFPIILPLYVYKRYDLFLDGLRFHYEHIE